MGNASDQLVSVSVRHAGSDLPQIDLLPHDTRTFVLPSNENSTGADWLQVDARAPVGSVRATGFLQLADGSAAAIRFYDPDMAEQSSLFATNVKAEGAPPLIVLRNTTPVPIVATPRFRPLEGSGVALDLPRFTVPPNGVALVDASPLVIAAGQRSDLERVSRRGRKHERTRRPARESVRAAAKRAWP